MDECDIIRQSLAKFQLDSSDLEDFCFHEFVNVIRCELVTGPKMTVSYFNFTTEN